MFSGCAKQLHVKCGPHHHHQCRHVWCGNTTCKFFLILDLPLQCMRSKCGLESDLWALLMCHVYCPQCRCSGKLDLKDQPASLVPSPWHLAPQCGWICYISSFSFLYLFRSFIALSGVQHGFQYKMGRGLHYNWSHPGVTILHWNIKGKLQMTSSP